MQGYFDDLAPRVFAQRTSSCDRDVDPLTDCSSLTSLSPLPDDSSGGNQKGDEGDDNTNQEENKESGNIEPEIPSTTGGGVPFP